MEECTFKPQTNVKNKPLKAKQSSYNHLYDDYRIRKAKLERLKSLQEEKELAELQNKPKINNLPQSAADIRNNEDLIERLSRPKEKTVDYTTESFTFVPKINKYKNKVGHSKEELYELGVKKEQNKRGDTVSSYSTDDISECTFSPVIDEHSKKIVENESITSINSTLRKTPIKTSNNRKMVKSQSFKSPINPTIKNDSKSTKHKSIQLPPPPVDNSDSPNLP